MLIVAQQLIVAVQLIGKSAFTAVLDFSGQALTCEWDFKLGSQLHYDDFLHALITIEMLLKNSRVVPVGLSESQEGMVIVAAADSLCILWIGWSRTVEDLGVPVVFPACPSP